MSLIKLALAGVAGYALYKYVNAENTDRVALASGEGAHSGSFAQVRNSGPEAMRDKPPQWQKVDELSDQSFPASDPPATY
ncbi:MAG: hypothetical protein ABIT04_04290 [Novosphingobium sp.]